MHRVVFSWLGRESHKSVAQSRPDQVAVEGRKRGGSLGVSQGPRGDAWSGVERRRSYRNERVGDGQTAEAEPETPQDEEYEGKLDARSAAMVLSAQL